ncbi:MAG TPA: replication protein, partial [Clostridiales bacterium]|nr:replication protein [Clostridiales bacterium]
MAEVKWIKITTDMFDNRKIKQIRKLPEGDSLIAIWVQILCLAGQINDNGMVYFAKDIPYTEEMLSVEFDRPINLIRLALGTFERFRMIDVVDSILLVSNWEKYQSTDKLEKIREQNRLRQQKFKENQKLLSDSNVTVTLPITEGNVTDIDIDIDKDIDNICTELKSSIPEIPKEEIFISLILNDKS